MSAKTIAASVGACLAALAALFAILDSDSASDVWRALWPGWIVLALVLAVVGVVALPRLVSDPAKLKADRKRWREMQRILGRDSITWVREHYFGTPWAFKEMLPFDRFAEYNEVEHRFLDRGLEKKRMALHAAVVELTGLFASETFPWEDGSGRDMQGVGTDPVGARFFDSYQEISETRTYRSRLLHEAGVKVGDRYDELYELARRKFKS